VARWAAFIQRHQDPAANWLTVDAGNYVDRAGAKGGCSSKCQFLVNSYADLKYDVLNIARQEVSMGYETLVALRDTTKGTEYVSANLLDVKSNKLIYKPYVVKDYGNMEIGIIGLLRDADFPATTSLVDTTVMRVTDTKEAAAKYLPGLIKKTDAVVLLCELPSDDLDSLVKTYPDIDVIISTGALRSGETMTMIGKTRVFGTGSSGYNGHYAMLEFNPTWQDSIAVADFKDPLADSYEQAGQWADRLATFEGKSGQVVPSQQGISTSPAAPGTGTTLSPSTKAADPHAGHSNG
jgi:2',3'-cyclic-nucleotide 2'-phosphodiesterase (5'-nucleotidase family)